MELCKDVLDGLSLLKKERVSDSYMVKILEVVTCAVSKEEKHEDHNDSSSDSIRELLPNIESKLSCLSLVSLFTEVCRQNTGEETEVKLILDTLTDCDIEEDRAGVISSKYREVRDILWKRLNSLQIKDANINSITDLNWRQEVIFKTNNRNKMSPLLRYLFSFKTDSGQDIDFQTDVSGLQQLSSCLREACKAVDNLKK